MTGRVKAAHRDHHHFCGAHRIDGAIRTRRQVQPANAHRGRTASRCVVASRTGSRSKSATVARPFRTACLVRRLSVMSRACDSPLFLVPGTFVERRRDRRLVERFLAVDLPDRRSCPGDARDCGWGKDRRVGPRPPRYARSGPRQAETTMTRTGGTRREARAMNAPIASTAN